MKKESLTSSFLYKAVERMGAKLLGLAVSIILARLLSPEDFGQIAIIMVFINLSQTFIESGLTTALVQNKDTSDNDYSTVYFISLGISVACIIILWIAAPFIGEYYSIDSLGFQIRIYSMTLIFGSFNSVQMAKMQKEMRFRPMMIVSLISTAVSGALGVVLAYMGVGIWALIAYYMSNSVINSILMIFVAQWMPKLVFSYRRAKVLFSFGWKMLISSVMCSVYNDIRLLIIGKNFSPESLGYYNRGEQFPLVISNTLDSSVQSVMFPALADAQEESERFKKLLRTAVKVVFFVVAPVMLGLAVLSDQIISVLLTDKWLPCSVYMQFICIGNVGISVSSISLVALKAVGRSDVYMKLEIIRRVVMVIILLIAILGFNSVFAIAVSYAVSMWIDVGIVVFSTRKYLNYGYAEHMSDLVKSMICALAMSAAVYMLASLLPNSLLALAAEVVFGAIIYIGLSYLVKNDVFGILMHILRKG